MGDWVMFWIKQFCGRLLLRLSGTSGHSPTGQNTYRLHRLEDLDLDLKPSMKSHLNKPRAQRGRPPKRSRIESGFDETHTSPPVTRARRSLSDQSGHPNQGGSPLQLSPLPTEDTDLPIQDNDMMVDNDCGPSSQPAQLQHLPDLYEMHRNRGDSTLQQCPTCDGHTGQTKEPSDNDVVVEISGCEIGCNPSSLRAVTRFIRPFRSVPNQGSCKSSGQDDWFRMVKIITHNRTISRRAKYKFLCGMMEAFREEAEAGVAKWKSQCQSDKEKAVLQKDNERLQKLLKESLDGNFRSKVVCHDVKVELDATGKAFPEVAHQHGSSNIAKQIECECVKQNQRDNLALKEFMRCDFLSLATKRLQEVLLSHPQMCSHKHKSTLKSKSSKSGQDKVLEEPEAICGSYTDEAATPKLLDSALSNAKIAVKEFQKAFFDSVKSGQEKPWRPLDPNVIFARPKHSAYHFKSTVNDIFFEGFENESFNTMSGVSGFLDPEVGQETFFKYYLHEQEQNRAGDMEDLQFREFWETKVSLLCQRLNGIPKSMKADGIEKPGGPKLASTFRAAAGSVWLLHKLAFSFEPPASIFRVERGADVDPNYMNTVVDLEDNERFIPNVGFMITPGLRLRKTVMPCEVYLAGRPTPD